MSSSDSCRILALHVSHPARVGDERVPWDGPAVVGRTPEKGWLDADTLRGAPSPSRWSPVRRGGRKPAWRPFSDRSPCCSHWSSSGHGLPRPACPRSRWPTSPGRPHGHGDRVDRPRPPAARSPLVLPAGPARLCRGHPPGLERPAEGLPGPAPAVVRQGLGIIVLWGLLFVLVLTMISGARELMTPGAWEKKGPTYKLASPQPPPVEAEITARFEAISRLGDRLRDYARSHGGALPGPEPSGEIDDALWRVPSPPAAGTSISVAASPIGILAGGPPRCSPMSRSPSATTASSS